MRNICFASTAVLASLLSSTALADSAKQPDDHAPLGVMGDHLHKKGEWMVGYHYRQTGGVGLRNGSDAANKSSVLSAYGEAATKTNMEMHMFEFMVGVSDDLTLMVMPQYMKMDMRHESVHGGGHSHRHEASGFGDTEVTGLYSLYREKKGTTSQGIHANVGLSLPTGSIDDTFADHHNHRYPLPYNMQFGSGTVDPIIGATYTAQSPDWSWGAQTINYIRFYENNNGYRQGNKYTATTWVARNVNDFASVSFRLDGEAWGNVHGRDTSLPITSIAGANPNEQAGERVMANVGLNLLSGKAHSPFAGQRLAAEFGVPIYQRFDGPQPDTDYRLTLGWQMAF